MKERPKDTSRWKERQRERETEGTRDGEISKRKQKIANRAIKTGKRDQKIRTDGKRD